MSWKCVHCVPFFWLHEANFASRGNAALTRQSNQSYCQIWITKPNYLARPVGDSTVTVKFIVFAKWPPLWNVPASYGQSWGQIHSCGQIHFYQRRSTLVYKCSFSAFIQKTSWIMVELNIIDFCDLHDSPSLKMTSMTQNDFHDSKWLPWLKMTYMTQNDLNDSKWLAWLKLTYMTQNDLYDSKLLMSLKMTQN